MECFLVLKQLEALTQEVVTPKIDLHMKCNVVKGSGASEQITITVILHILFIFMTKIQLFGILSLNKAVNKYMV